MIYPLTFEAMRIMDEIRRENHCSEAICAYKQNCVCWDELLKEMKDQKIMTETTDDYDGPGLRSLAAITVEQDIARMRAALSTTATLGDALESMGAAGWMFVPPNFVIPPRSRNEALAMKALCEQYLKDHPHD